MNLILVQPDIVWEDPAANHTRVDALLAASPPAPDALVVLPEMFATGFSLATNKIAEPTDGPTSLFLARLARTYRVTVVGGLVTRGADGACRNEALVFDPDGQPVTRYAKLQPFTFAGESATIVPGQQPVVFPHGPFTVAPFVCYDLRFPEHFRTAIDRGAELLVVIANWPAARQAHWTTLLRARAIENQAYVAGVNRTGRDPQHAYAGGSCIFGPRGELLADAGNAESVLAAELNHTVLLDYRREFPALSDRDRRVRRPPTGDVYRADR